MGSRYFKKPPYQPKLKPKFKKLTGKPPQYEQMHQTLGLAVLTVLMDANIRRQDEHMVWYQRPKQLVNILKRHSDEFVAHTLKEYDGAGADWMNTTANQIEEVMRAILTISMSAETNTEIQESRLKMLITEIKLLANAVETEMWNAENPEATDLAA
jgi:hypothetical protein